MRPSPLRVVVFGENVHEQLHPEVQAVYPDGMHTVIATAIAEGPDTDVRCVTLEQEEHGLTEEGLAETDVLFWWGHMAHDQVQDAVADRIVRRVNEGMGFVALHSGCHSKPFRRLMGTNAHVTWREAGEKERVWISSPGHPIAEGIDGNYFELAQEEMYGEPFNVPQPLETVFISWFAGGEVCRSGLTWRRGLGKVFYFRPGHETYRAYFDPNVRRILANAAQWAAPESAPHRWDSVNRREPLEPLPSREA